MKKAIVTGANGFIGRELLREMSGKGIIVYALVRNENENVDAIKSLSGVNIVYCELSDIAKLPELIADRDIDCCIHLAWAGSFGNMRTDYSLQLLNIKYSLDILGAISCMGVRRFVGAGTLAQKDVLNYHLDDGATPNTTSIYGIAKLSAELMTKAECNALGIEHIWCCLSNTYGEGNTTDNFVNMVCKKILTGERASFTAALQIYDFVYISDTARAISACAVKGRKNCSYYLGSGKERPLRNYIEIIRDTIDKSYPLYFGEIPFNGKSLKRDEYSVEKLYSDTNFRAEVPFEEGISRTVEWLKNKYGYPGRY